MRWEAWGLRARRLRVSGFGGSGDRGDRGIGAWARVRALGSGFGLGLRARALGSGRVSGLVDLRREEVLLRARLQHETLQVLGTLGREGAHLPRVSSQLRGGGLGVRAGGEGQGEVRARGERAGCVWHRAKVRCRGPTLACASSEAMMFSACTTLSTSSSPC